MTNPFSKATKEQIKLRLAISGVSGSGKTTWALTIAEHIAAQEVGRVAVLDTEGRSARRYAELFDFDVLDIASNFSPQTFIAAINAAEKHGYAVLIIDSFSHAWNGAGGVLEIVDKAAGNAKGSFTGWKKGRPAQDSLVRAILTSNIHIILTMRSKTEWIMEPNQRGTMSPKKAGVGVVQSNDLEYEMDVALLIHRNHSATVTKSRCTALNNIGEDFASSDTGIIADAIYGCSVDGEQRAATPPPVATEAGQGYVPETGTEGEQKHATVTIVKATKKKSARSGKVFVELETESGHTAAMFGGETKLVAAQFAEKGQLANEGQSLSFDPKDGLRVEIVWVETGDDNEGYWRADHIWSELDALFGERETAPMPGMPPEETGVDFYGEERVQ